MGTESGRTPRGRRLPKDGGGLRGWMNQQGREWLKSLVSALILFIIIRSFFVQAFKIPSGSMARTLLVGDYLLVNKLVYGPAIPFTDIHLPAIREPKRGDILVFKYPLDKSLDFVKRCIGVAGDTVEMRDKVLYVNGVQQEEDYVQYIDRHIQSAFHGHIDDDTIQPARCPMVRDNFGPFVVREKRLFVWGDSRDNSRDSRYWGFLPKKLLKGKALIIYWSKDAAVPLYDLRHKIRWNRIGRFIK